jgi:DNA-binding transcriptional LysR family regulator
MAGSAESLGAGFCGLGVGGRWRGGKVRIEQLEYVAVVARLGSFRRAADELHISQPALSGSVRSLERELGVDLLDRGRHGARMSDSGRELFPHILDLLDSFDRLRNAADEQHRSVRQVRLGTVNAATVPLLAPAIRQFRLTHQQTQVEVITAQQAEIRRGILEGSLDLGLVNYLDGDDLPPDLDNTPLLHGRPVVVLRADSPLAAQTTVRTADLLAEPLIVMRSGYLMHRYLHRLLQGRPPAISFSTDGAEMGKLMVAEGLGITVLPDYSVVGDPLEQHGVITWRPLADDDTGVQLVIQRTRAGSHPLPARDLHRIFVERAWPLPARLSERGPGPFKQSVPQAIEFVLLRTHPVRVLEHQVLETAHPPVEGQYSADYSLLASAIAVGVPQRVMNG